MTAPAKPASAASAAAHVHSSKHRTEIEGSDHCGCYFCFRIFPPSTIKNWVEGGQTALCPHCGLDAVVGSAHCQIDDNFLRRMHQQYFSYRSK
jgi:hypothetical protein